MLGITDSELKQASVYRQLLAEGPQDGGHERLTEEPKLVVGCAARLSLAVARASTRPSRDSAKHRLNNPKVGRFACVRREQLGIGSTRLILPK